MARSRLTGDGIDPRYTDPVAPVRDVAGVVLDVEALLARVEAGDRAAAAELGAAPGGLEALPEPVRFRVELAELRWLLGHLDGQPDDLPRELYSSLLERCEGHAERLAAVRALGEELHALERAGALPQAMVVRSRRRRD